MSREATFSRTHRVNSKASRQQHPLSLSLSLSLSLLAAHLHEPFVLFDPRPRPFSGTGRLAESSLPVPMRGPEIRRDPELIQHLIGDVWAQHRGMP